MMGPTTMMERSKDVLPPRSAWIEALGFMIFGLGLYVALTFYTYDETDFTAVGMNPMGIMNIGGPAGAKLGYALLSRFGVTAVIWPMGLLIWGGLTALGFMMFPKARRFIGFAALVIAFSAFAEIQFARWGWMRPSYGFGGTIGSAISIPLLKHYGFGGAIISLTVFAVVSLILTGNITFSRTADVVNYSFYLTQRGLRAMWKSMWPATPRKPLAREIQAHNKAGAPAAVAVEKAQKAAAASAKESAAAEKNATIKEKLEDRKAHDLVSDAKEEGGSTIEEAFGLELYYRGGAHQKPTPKIFSRSEAAPERGGDFKTAGDMLKAQLAEFKVMGDVKSVVEGPVVTTYEFEPAPGTKVAKISALGEDLARLLQATSLRVLAPIPGKNTVGFEIPNTTRRTIGFAELIESEAFKAPKPILPIAMGVDIFGKPVVEDLAEMPHLLVAGSTGAGKSVFMNTLIASLITRHSAKDLRLIMVDPKMVEMAAYNGLPHMACPVVTDAATEAKQKLDGLVVEMEDRYLRMKAVGAKNITTFNEIVKSSRKSDFKHFEGRWQPMPYIVLIVDELADMMMVLGKDAEVPITRLAQKARAAGIHLVIATQRPSADVVTGLIKANFPTRVSFRVLSGIDSRTILDQSGAEALLGKGDMLFLSSQGLKRLHGAFIADKEVQVMVRTAKSRA